MSMYNEFSRYYDYLTGDVDYKKRTKYLLRLFEKFDRKPSLLLDLACGTGGFSVQFSKAGIDVIGVDISEGMLRDARRTLGVEKANFKYKVFDCHEIPYDNEMFDEFEVPQIELIDKYTHRIFVFEE